MLYCGHCGARTAIPTLKVWLLKIACVLFYVAALALVVLAAIQKR